MTKQKQYGATALFLTTFTAGQLASAGINVISSNPNPYPNYPARTIPTYSTTVLAERRPINRFDVGGRQIDAHDGQIENFNGVYYWYGSSYNCGFFWPGTGGGNTPFCGVKVYRSYDLVTWVDVGAATTQTERVAFATDPSNASDTWQSLCRAGSGCFRPHVLFNSANSNYVMWLNYNPKGNPGGVIVLTSRQPEGPFSAAGVPVNLVAFGWDFGAFKDPITNKAYVIYNSRVRTSRNNDIWLQELNPSYTDGLPGCGRSAGQIPYPSGVNTGAAYEIQVDSKGVRVYDHAEFRSLASYPPCSTATRVFLSVEGSPTLADYDNYQIEAPAIFRNNGYWYAIASKSAGYSAHGQRVYYQKSAAADPVAAGAWKDTVFQIISEDGGNGQTNGVTRVTTTVGDRWMLATDLWSPFSKLNGANPNISGDGGKNQALAAQLWQMLSFDASYNMNPLVIHPTTTVSVTLPDPIVDYPKILGVVVNPLETIDRGNNRVWQPRCDIYGARQRAQSFTIPYDGKLTQVAVNVFSGIVSGNRPTMLATVALFNADSAGRPMGSVIESVSAVAANAAHPLSLALTRPLAVTAGQRFVAVVSSVTNGSSGDPVCHGVVYNDGNLDAAGKHYVSTNSGSTWTEEMNRDAKIQFTVLARFTLNNSGLGTAGCMSQNSNSTAAGAPVNGNNACVQAAANQQITALPVYDGSVALQFSHSGMCVTTPAIAGGHATTQAPCSLSAAQRWLPKSVSGYTNVYNLVNGQNPNICLYVELGTATVNTFSCKDYAADPRFLWRFNMARGAAAARAYVPGAVRGEVADWDTNYDPKIFERSSKLSIR